MAGKKPASPISLLIAMTVEPNNKSASGQAGRKNKAPGRDLFTKRMLFVTGKGGVGKTTVTAALGLVASRAGLRTIVCELAAQERIGQLFGHASGTFAETEVAPDLHTITIDPQHAIEEYLLLQIRVRPVYDLLFKNRVFDYFAAATPGLNELVTIGKVWELAQAKRLTKGFEGYDLVIVDAPATGHGLALLEAPTTFQRIARVGPINRQAGKISSFLHDKSLTGVIAVATAEEMPVNETVDLRAALRERVELDLDLVVVNAIEPMVFTDQDIERVARLADGPVTSAALAQHERATSQAGQLERLKAAVKRPLVELPFLYENSIDRHSLNELADELELQLAGPLAEVAK